MIIRISPSLRLSLRGGISPRGRLSRDSRTQSCCKLFGDLDRLRINAQERFRG